MCGLAVYQVRSRGFARWSETKLPDATKKAIIRDLIGRKVRKWQAFMAGAGIVLAVARAQLQ